MAEAVAAFDRLGERDTEILLLFGNQEALYQEFARHGVIDQLNRWPNIRLQRIPSRDQMFRAQWVQRHVHQRVDEALERTLARFATAAYGTETTRDVRRMLEGSHALGRDQRVNDIDRRLQDIAREVFGDDSLVLTDSTNPVDVPGWDSFGHVNFILSVESEFGVEFSDDEFVRFVDIGGLKRTCSPRSS